MIINKKGLDLVKSFEGCRLESYKCPAGVWTIGYGHTKNVTQGMKITNHQADNFLLEDIKSSEKAVENLKLKLNENQFSALVSFTFNCGPGNLKKLVSNRTLPQIADAILLYNKANGKELAGLVRRRKAERELFLTPVQEPIAYPTLKRGMSGNDVKKMQLLLCAYGFKVEPDGLFGKLTQEAVMAFQIENTDNNGKPLAVDGIVGRKTWEALLR